MKDCPLCQKRLTSKVGYSRHIRVCSILTQCQEEICEKYLQGASVSSLAVKYGVGTDAIKNHLKQNNIKVTQRRNKVDTTFFSRFHQDAIWLIGLMAADGWVNSNMLSWGLGQSGPRGEKLLKYICRQINYTNKITKSKTCAQDSFKINVSSKQMVRDLGLWGITPRKTHSYSLPDNKLKPEYFKQFLEGYIDGDGSIGVYNNGKGVSYLCISFVGSPEFIQQCIKVIPFTASSHSKKKGVEELRYTGQSAVVFGNWVYGDSTISAPSYKKEIFEKYISCASYTPPEWSTYNQKRNEASKSSDSVADLSSRLKIPDKTLYKWRASPVKICKIGKLYCKIPHSCSR